MAIDRAELESQYRRVQGRFRDFVAVRREWDALIKRRRPVELSPDLSAFGAADVESPVVEKVISEHVQILLMNQSKLDIIVLDEGARAEQIAARLRMWFAYSQYKQNKSRWRDRFIAQCQVQYGVAVIAKEWEMLREPKGAPVPNKIDDLPAWAAESEKKRVAYYRDAELPFRERGVNPLTCAWLGRDMEHPELFFEEAEFSYEEAQERLARQEKRLTLNVIERKLVVGPRTPVSQIDAGTKFDQQIRFLRRAMIDPRTGKCLITEYVYPASAFQGGDTLDEYECPGGMPYFIIPSGSYWQTETNPHFRYRPMIFPLLVYVDGYNQAMTIIAALGRRSIDARSVFVPLRGLNPEVAQRIEATGTTIEGAGSQGGFTFKAPEISSNELPVYPDLALWPNNISEAMIIYRDEMKEGIQNERASRFLTGPSEVTVTQSTASGLAGATQASGLPYGAYLQLSDSFQEEDILWERRCLLAWDDGVDGDKLKQYFYVMTGRETFLKGSTEAGQSGAITADELRMQVVPNVVTSRETEAERQQRKFAAYQDRAQGVLTFPQLLREVGYDDEMAQVRKLNREANKVLAQQLFAQRKAQAMALLAQALTGLDFVAAAGSGGSSPVSAGQTAADSTGLPPAVGPSQPEVAPPLISGPSGGGNSFTTPGIVG